MSAKQQLAAIGLDIGGTKIAAGVVLWSSGEILNRRVIPTNPTRGGEPVLSDTLDLSKQLYDRAQLEGIHVAGIGAGVPEFVDTEGNVTSSCTIHWRDVPVQQRLSEIAPAVVESDVRAAALAEATFGAGKECRLFVYVTVGTGISYCLMQEGRPFTGANGNAITLASSPLSTVCTHCGAKLHPVLWPPNISQPYTRSVIFLSFRYFTILPTSWACSRVVMRIASSVSTTTRSCTPTAATNLSFA